jgi:hypothetical protein
MAVTIEPTYVYAVDMTVRIAARVAAEAAEQSASRSARLLPWCGRDVQSAQQGRCVISTGMRQ